MPMAISAGSQARKLVPTHYYVNLGLARAFFQQKQWRAAVERAEDAVVQAPGASQRVEALFVAARSAFQARDATKGCALLRRASEVQSSRALLDELESHACTR